MAAESSSSAASSPVSVTLSGNKLVLGKNGKWTLETSDLDLATLEIERLLTEKEDLTNSLSVALTQAENLKSEVQELNRVKGLLLEMLMKERQQRIELEGTMEAYKDELRENYKAIVELRKALASKE